MPNSNWVLEGIYPPITTPFDGEGAIAHDKLAANVGRWNATKLAGLVVLGSNGEYVYLNKREKLETIATVKKHLAPGKRLIAGTGCESTLHTIGLTRQAADLGADAAIIITPNYYKSAMDHAAMVRHYLAVADASPIPLVVYNMPAYAGVDLAPGTVIELAKHPNIMGLKESSGNVAKMGNIIGSMREDFSVMAGSAGFLYQSMVVGAKGGVCALANVAPDECCDIYEFARAGRHDDARVLQIRMIPPNGAVTTGFGIPGLKYAMELLGYYGGPVRSPLGPLSDQQKGALRAIFVRAGLL